MITGNLVNTVILIISAAFLWVAISYVFAFFDIKFETYGSYLIWMVALIIFYIILNPKMPNLFQENA
tara:strand:+ start:129 stop:329 length:201 start_codon:yes stop_codon:yes gene_type:complete